VTQVNGETQGIICIKAFACGDFKRMRITFYRSIILNYIMTLCAFLIYAKMDFLLISIGFEEVLSQKTWLMVVSIIPS
jgi:hypothetical protein